MYNKNYSSQSLRYYSDLDSTLSEKAKHTASNWICEVHLVKMFMELQNVNCQVEAACWGETHRRVFPDSIRTNMPSLCVLISQGSNGVTGTVWRSWAEHRSLVAWIIINTKHAEEQTLIQEIKSSYSTPYFKVKWAGARGEFVLSQNKKM